MTHGKLSDNLSRISELCDKVAMCAMLVGSEKGGGKRGLAPQNSSTMRMRLNRHSLSALSFTLTKVS
eukprot:4280199-Prymnesium_polylepis.1